MYVTSALAVFAVLFNGQQDLTLKGVLSGQGVPLKVKTKELPTDFRAVEVLAAGTDNLFSNQMMWYGLMRQGSNADKNQNEILKMFTVCWTKGDIVTIDSVKYYVTYAFNVLDA